MSSVHFHKRPDCVVDADPAFRVGQRIQTIAHRMKPFGSAFHHPVDGGLRVLAHHSFPSPVKALVEHEGHEQIRVGFPEPRQRVNDDRPTPKRQKLLGDRPVHAGARAARDEDERSHAAKGQNQPRAAAKRSEMAFQSMTLKNAAM